MKSVLRLNSEGGVCASSFENLRLLIGDPKFVFDRKESLVSLRRSPGRPDKMLVADPDPTPDACDIELFRPLIPLVDVLSLVLLGSGALIGEFTEFENSCIHQLSYIMLFVIIFIPLFPRLSCLSGPVAGLTHRNPSILQGHCYSL